MKINIFKSEIITSFFVILLVALISCSSDSSDGDGPIIDGDTPMTDGNGSNGGGEPNEGPMVETLVSSFNATDGLSLDSDGNIYASNFANFTGSEVLKINSSTSEVTVAVDGLVAPTGNFVDSDGIIYVVNNIRFVSGNSGPTQADVLKFSPDGSREVLATLPGFPAGITLDEFNNAYVSNFSFSGVHKITPTGEVSVYAEDNRLFGGVGIDFDDNGNLFVGNFSTGDILKITENQTIELLTTIPTVVENVVIGYISYFSDSIYATAAGEHTIYKVSMEGEATIFAGNGEKATIDGSLLEASFDTPNGITVDPVREKIYVSQGSGAALRVIELR